MPLIENDKNGVPLVVDLSEEEKIRWRKQFGDIRKKEQLPPAGYIDLSVEKLGGYEALSAVAEDTTKLIFDIRETAWQIYIQHEQMVCGQAMEELFPDQRLRFGDLMALAQIVQHLGDGMIVVHSESTPAFEGSQLPIISVSNPLRASR